MRSGSAKNQAGPCALRAQRAIPALALALVTTALAAHSALAQPANPVYVDDSPGAADGLERARSLAASGNVDEGVRVLQKLLDTDADRLVPAPDDTDLFITVRNRINGVLLADDRLLDAYRRLESAVAERLLQDGKSAEVERSLLLTPAGFEAALRVAQRRLEAGAFDGAWQALRQLEKHPDRTGAGAREAADLLTTVSRYVDRAEVRDTAKRWRSAAGLAPADGAAAPSVIAPPPITHGLSPLERGPAVELSDMVSKPLASESMSVDASDTQPDGAPPPGGPEDVPPSARLLHILPTVAGDTIYVNDSQSVSAWDRFTLELKWRVNFTPVTAGRRASAVNAGMRAIEDMDTVTVIDNWALATTGLAVQGVRDGDGRVHAFDARTGQRRWSVDVATLDPALDEASVRGPVIVDQGLAIVTTVTRSRLRRLLGVHLVALDLATGQLVWQRLLATTGALPYAYGPQTTDGATEADGVLYVVDRLGCLAAVEAASGRVYWVRRLASEGNATGQPNTWEASPPQIIGANVYVLAPDQRSVLSFDRATGHQTGERSAGDFARPRYLLSLDGTLIVVCDRAVQAVDAAQLGTGKVRTLLQAGPAGIRGRVMLADGRVLAPTARGLLAADVGATDPDAATVIPLDEPGNVLALESQFVVVDDSEVHTYLLWGVAERILAERIAADPTDATPAAVAAELAFRAGKPDKVLPAIDSALRAIEAAPLSERNKTARQRLFQSAMAMVDPDPHAGTVTRLERAIEGQVIERLARLATTPADRVRQLLALGTFQEAGDAAAQAVEAYQRILTDGALAGAVAVRHGASFDAEVEATRRLQRVLRQFGRAPYAGFEAEAERALVAATGDLDPDRFTAIARRYPVARAAAKAWLAGASAYEARGRSSGATYALERGLRTAEDALPDDDPLIGELAGRLIASLVRADRVAAANATLARVLDRWPALQLTDGGRPVDLAALRATVSERLASLQRRPRVGTELGPSAQLLTGWTLLDPLIDEPSGAAGEFIVLANDGAHKLGLYGVDGGGGVRLLWTTDGGDDASLLRIDDTAVYVSRSTPQGVTLNRLDIATGKTVWSTAPFRTLFPIDPDVERRLAPEQGVREPVINTPLQQRRPIGEVLVTGDGRTLAMVERTGRAAAVDLDSGRVLWTRAETARVVNDVVALGGALVVGGGDDRGAAARGKPVPDPVLVAIDLRTGRTLHDLQVGAGQVRWVRGSPEGLLIAGLDDGVAAFDLFQGRVRWLTQAMPARLTLDAWTFTGRVITLTARATLVQFATEDGAMRPEALDVGERIGVVLNGARAQSVGDRAVFATTAGVMVYDPTGALVGRDHRRGDSSLALGRFAQDYVVTIDQQASSPAGESPELYTLQLFTLTSAALAQERPVALGAQPTAIGLLDGRVLITAGDATMVVDANGG